MGEGDPFGAKGGEDVEDLSPLDVKEGQVDPFTKKMVLDLVLQSKAFVVFVDTDMYVQWWYVRGWEKPERWGEVVNRQAKLESIPINTIDPSKQRTFRRLVAEGVARAMDNEGADTAKSIFDEAEGYIRARLGEVARSWLLQAGFTGVCVAVVYLLVVHLWAWTGRPGPWFNTEFLECIGLGVLGASASFLSRLAVLPASAEAGRSIHYKEGVARMMLGGIAGGILWIALRAGVLPAVLAKSGTAGVLATPDWWLTAVLAFASGWSERLFTSIVDRAASTTGGESK